MEVNFHRLYVDQPTFADINVALRSQGFLPQSVVASKTWPLAPVPWADRTLPVDEGHARQLVEADMLYVRDLARLDAEQLRHLALVCDAVYAQRGVGLLAIRELIRRGDLPPTSESRYRAA